MGGRRLSSKERRQRILGAATTAFARKGYADASMDEIARTSGVTKPVLYDHFASKDALLLAVLEGVRGLLLAKGEEALRAPVSRERQVRAAVAAFLTLAETSPDAIKVLLAAHHGHPQAAAAARAIQAGAVEGIAALLKRTAPDVPAWALAVEAQFVLNGLHSIALWWFDNKGVGKEELVDIVANLLWKGLSSLEAAQPTGNGRMDLPSRGG